MHLLKTLHNRRRSSEEVSISDARGRIEQLDIAFQHGCLDTEAKQRIQQLESLFRRRHLTSEQEPSGSSNRGDVYFSPQVTRRAKSLLESLQPHELSLSPRLGIRASLRRSECPEREAEQLDPNDFVRSGFGRCSSRSLGSHSETIEEENFDDRDEDGEEGVCYQTLSAVPSAAAIQPSFGCSEQPPLEQHPQAQLQPQRQQRGTSDGLAESGGKQTAIAQHAGEERGIRNLRKSVSVHGDLVQFPCRALPRRISEGNLDLSRAQPPPLPPPRKPGLIPRAASKTSLRKSSDECGSGKCRITRRSQSVVEGHSPGLRKEFEHVARQVERAQSLNSSCESPRLRRVPSDASTPQSSRRRNSVSSGYEDLSVSWNERYIGTPDVRVISNGQHHPARVICQQKSSFDSTISCLSQTADSCPRSAAQGTDNTYFVKPKSTDSPRNSLNAKHDKSPSQGEACQFSRADTKRRARRQNSYTFKPISVPDDEDDADELNPTPTQSNCDIPIKEWLQTMFPGLETADRENLESFIMDSSERAKRLLQSRGVRIPLLQRSNSQDTKRPNDVDLKRPDFPCFWKTHARTPSDGSQEVAKLLKSPSQGDRPLQAVTPPNEDKPGIFQRMFRRSQSRERTPGPPSDNEKSPEKSRKHKNKQIEVKIKRYRSLSPRPYECPTPPLAMFSSDEDISSVPQTPEHTPQKAFESQPTISPQLESQISKLMLEPVKPRVANASTTTSRDAIGDNRKPRPISIATTGDYPQHKPPTGKGLRKSSAGAALARVYAADLPPQISISPAKPLPPKPLPAKPRTKYTREYREKRHHTLDLGGMQHENSKSQVTTLRSHSMGSRADQADIQAKTLRKQYAASKDIVISAPNPQIKGHSLPILDPAGQTPLQIGSNDSGFNQDEVSSDCLKIPSPDIPTEVVIRQNSRPAADRRRNERRPKSESLNLRVSDANDFEQCNSSGYAAVGRRLRRANHYDVIQRTCSDLGSRGNIVEAVHEHVRRMSTPQPIKVRQVKSPANKRQSLARKFKRAKSAPDLLDSEMSIAKQRQSRMHRISAYQVSSAEAGDLAVQPQFCSSDEEEDTTLEDALSIGPESDVESSGSDSRQAILDEIFEEEAPTFAEALWDHVTMDTEELGFRAGEVIEVMDMTDKDWWWGRMASSEGWFPAAFVRLRANQMETADDLAQKLKEGEIDSTTAMRRYSCNTLLSKEQARTNVVREILHAEKEYIRHISDVIEGYIEKASKRPEMFSAEMLRRIFGNMEEIHKFSAAFLRDLEVCIRNDKPQSSEIGACFIKHQKGFEIYSEYCNNHPIAIEELRLLQKDSRYHQFFEACRLLQQMINIPLEGFLLNPVQKICKYPLQLKELLKHTRPEHPDYEPLKEALDTMKQIALLINERKRKMESLEKLAEWQDTVENWQGEDLIDISSELIFSGEMTKVNRNGGNQERIYFLFDNQLVYCRKDKLWRDVMVYKGRIGTNSCQVIPLQDGKDNATGTTVKNAFSIYDNTKEKSYVLCCRTALERERWLSALRDERKRVEMDKMNGFNLQEFKAKMASIFCHTRQRARNKGNKLKKSQMIIPDAVLSHSQNNNSPASSHRSKTLHRSHNTSSLMTPTMSSHPKTPVKRSWFPFKSRKN